MRDDLVAAVAMRSDKLWAMVIALSIEENGEWQLVLLEKLDETPTSNAIAVFTPSPVVGVWMTQTW
jgi:hypothetical protein